jgi:hypothetical protein
MGDSFWNRFGLELILLTFIIFLGFAMYNARDLPAQQQNT